MKIELDNKEVKELKTALNNQIFKNKEWITKYVIPDEIINMLSNQNIVLTNILTQIEVQDDK